MRGEELQARLEGLRRVLYAPRPRVADWEALCALLDALSAPELVMLAVSYCLPLLEGWPSWVRVRPARWGVGDARAAVALELSKEEREALRREEEVVWCEAVEGLDYVRERFVYSASASRAPYWRGSGRVVGWVRQGRGAGLQRVFVLREYDRDAEPEGAYGVGRAPGEAVDPRTVRAGVCGVSTVRARLGAPEARCGEAQRALAGVSEAWAECQRCRRGRRGGRPVFGSGGAPARVVVLGMAPSGEGRSFGQGDERLLGKIIEGLGVPRGDVFVSTAVKCEGGEVFEEELVACRGLLKAQVEALSPALIVALGVELGEALLQPDPEWRVEAVVRGQWGRWEGVPLLVTWGLGALRGDARRKGQLWGDVGAARAWLSGQSLRPG